MPAIVRPPARNDWIEKVSDIAHEMIVSYYQFSYGDGGRVILMNDEIIKPLMEAIDYKVRKDHGLLPYKSVEDNVHPYNNKETE